MTLGVVRLADLPLAAVRRRVLVVERDSVLLAGSLEEALAVPRRRGGRSSAGDVDDALFAAAALDIVEGLPDGLRTRLPERARSLSGGQRRRYLLAPLALVADPEVLVLDDPTTRSTRTPRRRSDRLRRRRGPRA